MAKVCARSSASSLLDAILAEALQLGLPHPPTFDLLDDGKLIEWATPLRVSSIEISDALEIDLFDLDTTTTESSESHSVDLDAVLAFLANLADPCPVLAELS